MVKKLLLFVLTLVISATVNVYAQSHKVTFESVGNGSISMKQMSSANGWSWESFESGAEFEEGTWLQTLTVADAGYKLISLTCNEIDVTSQIKSDKYYNMQVGSEDVHFVATFEGNPDAEIEEVTYYVTANGTAAFSTYYGKKELSLESDGQTVADAETGDCFAFKGTAQVNRGEHLVLALTPESGKQVTSLLVNDQEMFEKVNHDALPYTYITPEIDGPMVIKVFFGDNTDGIKAIEEQKASFPCYNLQGQRVNKAQHGIIIHKGRKAVF